MDIQIIQNKIYEIRGQRVMLDFDLAELYQVPTKVLKQAVRRNSERFPSDFMFEITESEYNVLKISLRSQSVTSNKGGIRYMPFAVYRARCIHVIGRIKEFSCNPNEHYHYATFVAMRNYILQSTQVSAELLELRSRLQLVEHDCRENLEAVNDLSEDMRKDIDAIYEAIGALSVKLPEAKKSRQPIGFKIREKE